MSDTASKIIAVSSKDEIPGGILPFGEGLSEDEAAAALLGLEDSEEEETADEEGTGEEDSGLEADEDDDGEEDDDSEEEDESDDESEDDEDDEEYLIEVTLPGGEKVKLPESEVAAGYSRTEDYTRKRQADAEAHRQAMAEVAERRNEYLGRLKYLREALVKVGPQEPSEELRRANPGEWSAQMAEYTAFQQGLEKIGTAEAAAQQEITAEEAEAAQRHVAAEWTKVTDRFPEWRDQGTFSEELKGLRAFASEKYHFTDKDMDALTDSRLMILLTDAYRATQKGTEAKKTVEKKKAEAKERLKPGSPQSRKARKGGKRKAHDSAAGRLKQSGSVHDAAAAIAAMNLD